MKYKSFTQRIYDAAIKAMVKCKNKPRFVRYAAQLRAFEGVTYTAQDLRGLSKREKEFITGNGGRCYIDARDAMDKPHRYYLFKSRDLTTGRRKLYAMDKRQLLNVNGHDISPDVYNYSCWLIVDFSRGCGRVNRLRYECRFSERLAPVVLY